MSSAQSLRSPKVIQNYWGIVERYRATIVSGVPTSIAALAEVPLGSRDISSVRISLTGGAVLPKAIGERFQERTGIRLFETYGMTETAAAIAFNPGRGEPLAGSVGFRAPYARTKIVSLQNPEELQDCPKLTSGLVVVRGPQVFPGYVDPQHNTEVLTDDGWLVTGDIGYLTEDERLILTGRAKDLIVRSGHNIDPAAIEDVAKPFQAYRSVPLSACPINTPARCRSFSSSLRRDRRSISVPSSSTSSAMSWNRRQSPGASLCSTACRSRPSARFSNRLARPRH
jgi:fatty-acyl-CoA synthase